jgi:hypothetical protein
VTTICGAPACLRCGASLPGGKAAILWDRKLAESEVAAEGREMAEAVLDEPKPVPIREDGAVEVDLLEAVLP